MGYIGQRCLYLLTALYLILLIAHIANDIGTEDDLKLIFIYNTALLNKNLDFWISVNFARLKRYQKSAIIDAIIN